MFWQMAGWKAQNIKIECKRIVRLLEINLF